MALIDLTPEQLNLVENALVAPPPQTFQEQMISPELRARAASGMLGSAGRFIEQMAREQERKAEESRISRLAQEAASINPLDPDYDAKVKQIAMRDPAAFATAPVQQALNLGDATRKQAMEQAQYRQAGQLFNLPPEQRQEALRSGNPLAFKNLPLLQKAEEMDVATEEALSQLPEFARPTENLSPARAKLELKKFESTLPPVLRKVQGLENRQYAVQLAKQWEAAQKKDETLKKSRELPENGFESDRLLNELTVALGGDPSKTTISEETARALVPHYSKFYQEEPKPKMNPLVLDIADPRNRYNPATNP